ncbi:hypothetical protein GALL_462650 [mine drainage metagenome]|uniref:Uncharacterized protein n=1 Tax=mine drainage metagenome TaxID=410659 RepID=A0A1J5Q3S9_9ZZZZ
MATDEGALGLADIINCDWLPGATHDGVAIVTGLPGPLVSCHTTDHQNVPYKAISHSAPNYLYTTTLVSY